VDTVRAASILQKHLFKLDDLSNENEAAVFAGTLIHGNRKAKGIELIKAEP
jgi:hypothetical protein